ncbi:MAG: hypothetical protein ACTSUE_02060 [Promethearchaeota archaeon]
MIKRTRVNKIKDEERLIQHQPGSLMFLSANNVPGPAGHYARLFEKTQDHRNLELAMEINETCAKSNVKGRIPPPRQDMCGWSLCPVNTFIPKHGSFCAEERNSIRRENTFGKELELARMTDKMIGTAVVQGSDFSGGVVIRVDSIVYPEMWMEITLSPEQVREAASILESSENI